MPQGYKNIINKGIELNDSGVPCPLMMETSGHGAMRVGDCSLSACLGPCMPLCTSLQLL
jgi:hypothetical protein